MKRLNMKNMLDARNYSVAFDLSECYNDLVKLLCTFGFLSLEEATTILEGGNKDE